MELTTYCQCACASCGQVIDYRASRAGEVVECPKCGEQSVLPEAEKLGMIELFGPPIPQFRDCPACGARLDFAAPACAACEITRKKKRQRTMLTVGVSLAVILCAAGLTFYNLHRARNRASAASRLTAEDLHPIQPTGPRILIEAPRPRAPKSTNDLHFGIFKLEKPRGGDLIIAAGDIQNVSENTHSQILLNLDLLDKNGAKVGSVSDYSTELGPHQTWHFVATVTESNAASARVAGFKEAK